jgi:hypothetical protein
MRDTLVSLIAGMKCIMYNVYTLTQQGKGIIEKLFTGICQWHDYDLQQIIVKIQNIKQAVYFSFI